MTRYIVSAQWSLGDEAEVFTVDATSSDAAREAAIQALAEARGDDPKEECDMGDLVVFPLNEVPHLTPGD